MNFSQGQTGTKVRCESRLFSQGKTPQTSFEAKQWLEVNFPSQGKLKFFPRAVKAPFPQTLHFLGKQCIPRERESHFQGKIIPQRENFSSEGKSAQFSLGGKSLPQKVFWAPEFNSPKWAKFLNFSFGPCFGLVCRGDS